MALFHRFQNKLWIQFIPSKNFSALICLNLVISSRATVRQFDLCRQLPGLFTADPNMEAAAVHTHAQS